MSYNPKILGVLEFAKKQSKQKFDRPDQQDRFFYAGKVEAYNDAILLLKNHSLPDHSQWIQVSERLPENEKNVLGTFKNSAGKSRVIRCFYARKFQVELYDDPYEFGEYNEEKDEYYLPEGWYESNEYEEINYQVSDEITHWQPLPPPPLT